MGRSLVIFDFDGTIADSFTESLRAYNRVAPRLRLRRVRREEIPGLRRMNAGRLMQALGIPMWKLPRLMISTRADLLNHFHSVKPVPGIGEALHDLAEAGHHLAIVTSNSEENVRGFLARHGLELFETVIAGASIFGKATRLRRLLRTACLDGSSSIYVGDTSPDIRAARQAGTIAIAVAWGFSDREPLVAECPDTLLESATELAPTVSRLLTKR